MSKTIKIVVGEILADAALNESKTARMVYDAPASVVNIIGKINNIAILYRKLKGGEKITFRR